MSDLRLEHVSCAVCESMDSEPVAVGEDFEYRTSSDSFLAVQCNECGLVYLDPRPTVAEFGRIYPDNYHAFVFSEEEFGLVYKVRRRLEARRVLSACADLPPDARILDVGCGDGFHLDLLREFGKPGWTLEGVDVDPRALAAVSARGFTTHAGTIEELDLEADSYDLVVLIQTIEHVADPRRVLTAIRRVLRPGGRLLIVTDNTGSPDFALARRRHWGGYHFPRHLNLFNRDAMKRFARSAGFEVATLKTMVSPVNWTYSVRNLLDDWGAPRWLVRQFSLQSAIPLAAFTVLDALMTLVGRGALLRVVLRKPS